MSLEKYIEELRPAIEEHLQRVIDQLLPPGQPELRAMLAYHLGWEGEGAGPDAQGKRIRPLLVLLSSISAGGDWQSALPTAAAVELVHNFSLIHDDIQDKSLLRRGRPAVWVKWGAAQAINSGDVLFTLAHLALYQLGEHRPAGTVLAAARMLDETCVQLTDGQYLDLSYETRCQLTLADYWPMVEGKTAALLSCCTGLGALTAGAGEERLSAYRRFGRLLGLAFQALDDWLGIWGDAAQTGKSTESDLLSGKKSLPVLYGLSQNGAFARRWLAGPVEPDEVPRLTQLLAEEGAKEYTQRNADRLTADALAALAQAADGSNDADLALGELAGALLKRIN